MNNIINIENTDLPVIEYQNHRVVTLPMIDKVHQRPEDTAGRRFRENRNRFIKGEDYFQISSGEIRRNYPDAIPTALHRKDVVLMTESGYLMLVKVFTDDLSWQVQRKLVKNYFRIEEKPAPEKKEVTEVVEWILSKVVNGRITRQFSVPEHCSIINQKREDTLRAFIKECDQPYLAKLIYEASQGLMQLQFSGNKGVHSLDAPLQTLPNSSQKKPAPKRKARKVGRKQTFAPTFTPAFTDYREILAHHVEQFLNKHHLHDIRIDELINGLKLYDPTRTRAAQIRMGKILKHLGYERYRSASGDREWRYRKIF